MSRAVRVVLPLMAATLVGLAGCARPPTDPSGATEDQSDRGGPRVVKGDLKELYAREIAPIHKVKLKVGDFTGEVESVGEPKTEEDENSARVSFSFGSGGEVKCFVYPTTIDVATHLLKLVNAVSGVDVQLVRPTEVVVVGDRVAFFLEVQYLAKTDGGKAAGELKLMAFDHPTTPMLCLHDELGYNATFKRITVGLASSLANAKLDAKIPRFVEVSARRIDGHPVGFHRTAALLRDDGKTVYIDTSAAMIPRSPRDVLAEDSTRSTVVDKAGRIVEMTVSETTGGEVSEDLKVKLIGGHSYAYEGTHAGKKVSGKLTTKNPRGFLTDRDVDAAVRKLFGAGAASSEVRVEEYHPDLDPTAPVEIVVRLLSKAERKVTTTLGKLQMTNWVDESGHPIKGEMPLGDATMSFERLFIRGAP